MTGCQIAQKRNFLSANKKTFSFCLAGQNRSFYCQIPTEIIEKKIRAKKIIPKPTTAKKMLKLKENDAAIEKKHRSVCQFKTS